MALTMAACPTGGNAGVGTFGGTSGTDGVPAGDEHVTPPGHERALSPILLGGLVHETRASARAKVLTPSGVIV
jgi:hypothetical protein